MKFILSIFISAIILFSLITIVPFIHGNYIANKYDISFDRNNYYTEEEYDIFWLTSANTVSHDLNVQIPFFKLVKAFVSYIGNPGVIDDSSLYNEDGILFSIAQDILRRDNNLANFNESLSLMYWISVTQSRNSIINYILENWMKLSSVNEINLISKQYYNKYFNELTNSEKLMLSCILYYGKNSTSTIEFVNLKKKKLLKYEY